jgi:hypothetical protein
MPAYMHRKINARNQAQPFRALDEVTNASAFVILSEAKDLS